MKPDHVKLKTNIDCSKEINDSNSKFKRGDIVRIWRYKHIFAKGYTPNLSEEVFVIKKVKKKLYRGQMLLMILMEKKLLERFMKRICKKQIKKNLELKK